MKTLFTFAFIALLGGGAPDPDSTDYADARATVEAAMIEINTDPEQGRADLLAALERLRDFAPLLAEDPEGLELRILAELTLARAQLASGDRYAASATVDATLEGLGGRPLSVERLGPSLGALVEERAQALAARGTARLRVECAVPCRVLVDERNAGDVETPGSARELGLPLGEHRVWVEALGQGEGEGDAAPRLRTRVNLDSADEGIVLSFPAAGTGAGLDGGSDGSAPAPSRVSGTDEVSAARDRRRDRMAGEARARIAPRWVEAASLATGGAAILAGAVLWALDSRCPRGADPRDVVACPQLYDTRTAGIALVSAGFVAGLTGGVMLVVDETRLGPRRGHELGLVWTAKF